ncbi:hypothetical protein LB516_03245 [Mesorhizobium sp. CO1-1-7]|uniref:hypothetical protein n=1 Tax=unclassified Mesorhizobium TaxID=325217 RepID=UPI00112E9912|nr:MULTISPECIES: hypothetical protein [unclassified Mesorhizobium]MBZ9929292.1 hypothetical protein [Mesorhizobium sp. BR1-1-5]MBZ9744261.1 hypothetical protein [Mesorhizobium sp. CO1-1-7]MBZ9754611.1 hypothetical protein [Mesorhizobium sp. ESP6-5]MBZ9907430.1 hypothetical protein [Mesorhizobium sp. BR115XR7A]TPJ16841.1 hypothetical protein FJW04_12365 [Mesorhizobium sp. B2-7-3]
MRTIICVTMLFLSAGTAFATGGIWCTVDDSQVKFQVDAGVTTGMGGPTFNFRGDLEIKARPTGDPLRKTVLEDANLTQYWLDDKELRLNIYHEQQVAKIYSSVELTILTRASDEGVYDGHYKLAVYDSTADKESDGKPVDLTGKVSCGAE